MAICTGSCSRSRLLAPAKRALSGIESFLDAGNDIELIIVQLERGAIIAATIHDGGSRLLSGGEDAVVDVECLSAGEAAVQIIGR